MGVGRGKGERGQTRMCRTLMEVAGLSCLLVEPEEEGSFPLEALAADLPAIAGWCESKKGRGAVGRSGEERL